MACTTVHGYFDKNNKEFYLDSDVDIDNLPSYYVRCNKLDCTDINNTNAYLRRLEQQYQGRILDSKVNSDSLLVYVKVDESNSFSCVIKKILEGASVRETLIERSMYSCTFETSSKSDYLLMLSIIDDKGWRRKAIGDDWKGEFKIEFDMHP